MANAEMREIGGERQLLVALIALGAGWLVVVAAMAVHAEFLVVRPLKRLSAAALDMASGALGRRAPQPLLRELADVGSAVNSLTDGLVARSREVEEYLSRNLEKRRVQLEESNAQLRQEVERREDIAEELRRSERELRDAQRAAHLGHWRWNPRTESFYSSEEVLQIHRGVPQHGHATEQELLACIAPGERASLRKALMSALAWGEPFAVDAHLISEGREGRVVRLRGLATPGPGGEGREIHGTVQDITDIRASELRINESQATLQALFTGAGEAIVIVDATGRVKDLNDAALRLGRDFVGNDLGRADLLERELMPAVAALFSEDKPDGNEVELADATGTKRWFERDSAQIRLDTGEVIGTALICREVTHRRSVEAQLLHAQKMESIGRLAGGIAHDFNNLLGAIIGYSELVGRQLDAGRQSREDIDEVLAAAKRAADLTRQLLAFSRQQDVEPQVIDTNTLLLDMDRFLRRLIGDDIEFACHTWDGEGDPAVRLDRSQFEQVVANLVVNARDAMPTGGTLSIATEIVSVEGGLTRPVDLAHGRYAVLTVRDTGTGMTDAVRSKIFEPFFTTKEPGKGTGLGLATCYGIVSQAGGRIVVDSEPGRGSSFHVYLPLVASNEELETPATDHTGAGSAHEEILLVEDQQPLRALLERVLSSAGYRVHAASTPFEALELIQNGAAKVQLVISDVGLPGLNGIELAAQIQRRLGPLPVLMMSGHADATASLHEQLGPQSGFLPKPSATDVVLERVRRMLDARGGAPPLH
jgi:signal transduction histidine kinase/ActR/RegA family two-component response regulator/HAMP domain-containing protein